MWKINLRKLTALLLAIAMITGFVPIGSLGTAYAIADANCTFVLDANTAASLGAGNSFSNLAMASSVANDMSTIVNYIGDDTSYSGMTDLKAALKFTVSGMTGHTIKGVTLKLKVVDINNSPTANVSFVPDNSWSQGAGTFPSDTGAVSVLSTQPVSTTGWESFSLGSAMIPYLSDGATVTLVVSGNSAVNSDKYFNFIADDNGTPADNAQLILSFTPTITSATYDGGTHLLTVTGVDMTAGDTIDTKKLKLVGEAGGSYTLTSSNTTATSSTSFTILLNDIDAMNVGGLLNKNGTRSVDGTTYNLEAEAGWDSTQSAAADSTGNGVTLSNTQKPTIISATYNAANGQLIVTGANLVKQYGPFNDVLVQNLTLHGKGTLQLTGAVEITSPTTITIGCARHLVNAVYDKDGTSASDGTVYTITAADDWNGPITDGDISCTTTGDVTVSNCNQAPVITSAASVNFAENGAGTVYTATATDANSGDTRIWSLGGTDAALFNLTAGGMLTFKTAPDREVPADGDANNVYDLTITVTDNGTPALSASQALAVTVTNVNEAPTVTTSGGTTAFAEAAGTTSTPVAIDDGITVADIDNAALASATVNVTGNFSSGQDVLGFANHPASMGNIAGSYNATTGVLTLTSAGASATVDQWQAALRSVTYTNTSHAPATLTRTLSFRVYDGALESTAATKNVSLTAANDAPEIVTSLGTAAFTENAGAVAVDGALTVADADNGTLTTATVTISGSYSAAQDILSFTNTSAVTFGNIVGSYNSTIGVLTLTSAGGTATVAQWQATLRAVTYSNVSENPSTATRTISFGISDGTLSSNAATQDVSISSVNDAPIVGGADPSLATVGEDDTSNAGSTIAALAGATLSDVDSAALGIAITGATGNGTWQYSTDGATWDAVGTVSADAALLLQTDAKIRYVPDGRNGETASFTYRAWDRSSGTNGNKASTTTNGGTTAYSTGNKTASITVTSANDTPTNLTLSNAAIEATATGSNVEVGTLATADVDTGDSFTYAFTAGAGDTDNGSFALAGNSLRTKTALAKGTYQVRVKSTDSASASYEKTFTLTVTSRAAKTLTADTTGNSVDNTITITFATDAAFESAVTGVSVDGTALSSPSDYAVSAGTITLKPGGSNSALTTAGSKLIVVTAAGYEGSTVTQTLTAGAIDNLTVTTQPVPGATGAAFATQPVVKLYDQYNNLCADGVSASANVVASAAAGTGTWTLGGTASVNADKGVASFSDLTCTFGTIGTGKIKFDCGVVNTQSSAFAVPEPQSAISPTSATFDRYASSAEYKDIVVTMTLNGNTLTAVKIGSATLVKDTDYTIAGTAVTLKKECLAKQMASFALTFVFSAGSDQTLAVALKDTTPSGGGAVIVKPTTQPLTADITVTSGGVATPASSVTGTYDSLTHTISAAVDSPKAQTILDIALAARNRGKPAVASISFGDVAGAEAVSVSMPTADLKAIANAKATLKLESSVGTVVLSPRTLAGIASAAGSSGTVSVGIRELSANTLSPRLAAKVGNSPLYQFSVTAGGRKVNTLIGAMNVTLPYTPPAGVKPKTVTIFYVDSRGVLRSAKGKYDAKTGTVSLSLGKI